MREGERSLNKPVVYVSGRVLIDFTTNTIISMVWTTEFLGSK